MTGIKELLDRALPAQISPTSITRDAAVALGRRARRRRRAYTSVTVFTLTCVFIVGGYAFRSAAGGGHRVETGQSATATTSRSAMATPSVTNSRPVEVDPTAATAARLGRELLAAAARERPDATITGSRVVDTDPVRGPFEVFASQDGYKAFGEIKDSSGPGTLFVAISADGTASCQASAPNQTCQYRTGPRGEQIAITVTRGSAATATTYAVEISKPGGTWILAELNNYSQNDQPVPSTKTAPFVPHPQRALPPMTIDQMVDFVLTPGLVL